MENTDMKRGYRSLRDCVFHSPLGLSCLPSKTRQLASYYLPRQTGIEIEINDVESFLANREFLDLGMVDYSPSPNELRFRIHEGEKGLIELYKICQILKKYFALNLYSGIHYHTSAPFISHDVPAYTDTILANYQSYEWVLQELDKWKYTGAFNKRGLGCGKGIWVNLRPDLNTIEYRIGEMTFDYNLIVRRMIHCHFITKMIREQCNDAVYNAPLLRRRQIRRSVPTVHISI